MKVGDLVRIHQGKKGYTSADALSWKIHGVDKSKAVGIIIEIRMRRNWIKINVLLCFKSFNYSNFSFVYF